jgi:hypothetical protein
MTAFYFLIAVLSTLMFVDHPFELWRYVYWLPGFNLSASRRDSSF